MQTLIEFNFRTEKEELKIQFKNMSITNILNALLLYEYIIHIINKKEFFPIIIFCLYGFFRQDLNEAIGSKYNWQLTVDLNKFDQQRISEIKKYLELNTI